MKKKYVVRLTDAERAVSDVLVKKQRVSFQKVLRARVLLKADVDGPKWTDQMIADAFDCHTKTVENIRERFVTEGFEITLNGKPKTRTRGKILDAIYYLTPSLAFIGEAKAANKRQANVTAAALCKKYPLNL